MARRDKARAKTKARSERSEAGGASWIARALIALFALAAFARGVPHALLGTWDDDRFFTSPLLLHASWENFVSVWSEPHFEAYQPIHLLSYWLEVPWVGANGPAIHAVSLLLWVLALLALFEASRALGLSVVGASIAVLIVGVHPVQVEAVSWATGRKDIVALGLCALAVYFHAKSERAWDRRAWISRAMYVLACLAKTSALPLPLVLIAADLFLLDRDPRADRSEARGRPPQKDRPWRRALLAQLPSLLVALGLGALVYGFWSEASLIRTSSSPFSLVLATITHQLSTIACPAWVSPLYPIEHGEGFDAWMVLAGPLALAIAAVAAWRKRIRVLGFAVVGFLVLLAPVSNLVPLYFQWHDRHVSLALWPIAFACGAGIDALWKERTRVVLLAAPLLIVAALAVTTARYVGVWRDPETLFAHAAHTYPDSFYAWLNLGHARRDAGKLWGAVRAYDRAIDAANLTTAHDARFYAMVLIDERERAMTPSRATELTRRFHRAITNAEALRALGGEMDGLGYRHAVLLLLDRTFALRPISDDRLERAALMQLRRNHTWLTDYYLARLHPRRPREPELVNYLSRREARSGP